MCGMRRNNKTTKTHKAPRCSLEKRGACFLSCSCFGLCGKDWLMCGVFLRIRPKFIAAKFKKQSRNRLKYGKASLNNRDFIVK